MKFNILVLLVFATCNAAVHHHNNNDINCEAVKPIFLMKNITTADIPDQPVKGSRGLGLCPDDQGSCCTAEMEERLRTLVRRDLQSVIKHRTLSVQGVLETNGVQYAERLIELTRRSENRTQELFAHIYERLAPQARAPITVLHAELRRSLSDSGSTNLNDSSSEIEAAALEEAVNTFFSQLFPLVYRHSVTHSSGELSHDYAVCLQATMPEVRPFGDTPRALATAVSRSMKATRVLLRALRLGVEALDATERVWERGDECSTALLRMSYCARCSGLATVKPCGGYCLNVLRGCLAHLAELDSSWNGFVDGVEKLVIAAKTPSALLNAENVIRSLDTRISEAIMHAMENGPSLEKRVKIACGPAQWVESSVNSSSTPVLPEKALKRPGPATPNQEDNEPRLSELLHGVVSSLLRSKRFYTGLADTLCSDDSFAETAEDVDCWNGHRVAQYTKTVVGTSVGAQKYNPELAWGARPPPPDPRVAQLSDRLRHTRQLLLGQLSSTLEADSLVLEQGSGSGGSRDGTESWTDDEDGLRGWSEHGSGDGSGQGPDFNPDKPRKGTHTTSGPGSKNTGSGVSTSRGVDGSKTTSSSYQIQSWSILLWCSSILIFSLGNQ